MTAREVFCRSMVTLWLFEKPKGSRNADLGLDEPDAVLWVARAFAAARWDGAVVTPDQVTRGEPLAVQLSERTQAHFVDLLERLDADALRAARRLGSNWGDVYDLLNGEAASP